MPEYVVEADIDEIFSTSFDTFNTEFMEPIVRCKYCKFADFPEDFHPWCKKMRVPVKRNGFCAWGESDERFTGRGFVVDYTDQTECAAYTCLACGKRSYASAPKYCPQCGVKVGG